MELRIAPLLRRRARTFASALALLAASVQLLLPVLHGPHGVHLLGGPVLETSSGSFHAPAVPDNESATNHEASTCLRCRLVSQLGSLTVATTVTNAPDLRASRVHEFPVGVSNVTRVGNEAPPRAPPFPA